MNTALVFCYCWNFYEQIESSHLWDSIKVLQPIILWARSLLGQVNRRCCYNHLVSPRYYDSTWRKVNSVCVSREFDPLTFLSFKTHKEGSFEFHQFSNIIFIFKLKFDIVLAKWYGHCNILTAWGTQGTWLSLPPAILVLPQSLNRRRW